MKLQIGDLREFLHDLLKKEILESNLDDVASKYGINKTDRATLVKNEYDGKFSKFVEIVNAKGLEIVIRDPQVIEPEEAVEEVSETVVSEIADLETDIETLNNIILERDATIKTLTEEKEELEKRLSNVKKESSKNSRIKKNVNILKHKPLTLKERRERGYYDDGFHGNF